MRVDLTDEEIVALDGKCSEATQAIVNDAKARLVIVASVDAEPAVAQFVAKVVMEARTNGLLVFRHERITSCPVCGKQAGYARHTRYGKWHRKGDLNYDRPLHMAGVELAQRFLTFRGSVTVGCCSDCWVKAQPLVVVALADVRAEIPDAITGVPPMLKKHDNRKCSACGWEGHEGQMGKLPCLMSGEYHGQCPSCSAKNLPFGNTIIESVAGFQIVEHQAKQVQP